MQIYPSWFFPLLSPFNLEKRNGITRNICEFIVRLDRSILNFPRKIFSNDRFRSKKRHRLPAKYYFHRIRGACHAPRDSSRVIGESENGTSATWSRFVVHHRFNHHRNVTETRRITNIIVHEGGGILRAARSLEPIPRDSSFFLKIKDSLEKRSGGISRKSFDLLFFLSFLLR